MKELLLKASIFVLILSCLMPKFAMSQENMVDVVYLKNGSLIKGMIIENIPNVSLKIQTSDKKVYDFKMDEIEKYTKENVTINNSAVTNPNESNNSEKQFKHVIKIDPLSILIGYYKVMDEIRINQGLTLNLIGGYLSSGAFDFNNKDFKLNGFVVSPELRFYVLPKEKSAPNGFYIAPWTRFEYEKANINGQNVMDMSEIPNNEDSRTYANIMAGSVGVNLGVQFVVSKFITFDFFTGIGYGFVNIKGAKIGNDGWYTFYKGTEQSTSKYLTLSQIEDHNKIHLRAGVNIGIGF